MSEVMTIIVLFHHSRYRTFKDYYLKCVCLQLSSYFHRLPSYNRFLGLAKECALPMTAFAAPARGAQRSGNQLRGLHDFEGMPQQTHKPAQGFQRDCGARQKFHGLVLRTSCCTL
jgi:hypothetical protein